MKSPGTEQNVLPRIGVLAIQGDYAEAHVNLGIVYLRSGRLDEGIEHLRRALEIKPGLADAREKLAGALRVQAEARGDGRR